MNSAATWFARIQDQVMTIVNHKHAPAYLGGLSFFEAFIVPIPPDFILIPMSIADKQKAWYYAFITSFWSVAGGLVGYLIGVYLYESVGLWIIELYGMREHFDSLQSWYDEYGIWLIFLAGFLPIPYKVFTIASGVFAFALLPFLIGSIIGRSMRFFIVSGICYWASDSVLRIVEKFNSKVMILVSLVMVICFVLWTLQ